MQPACQSRLPTQSSSDRRSFLHVIDNILNRQNSKLNVFRLRWWRRPASRTWYAQNNKSRKSGWLERLRGKIWLFCEGPGYAGPGRCVQPWLNHPAGTKDHNRTLVQIGTRPRYTVKDRLALENSWVFSSTWGKQDFEGHTPVQGLSCKLLDT